MQSKKKNMQFANRKFFSMIKDVILFQMGEMVAYLNIFGGGVERGRWWNEVIRLNNLFFQFSYVFKVFTPYFIFSALID